MVEPNSPVVGLAFPTETDTPNTVRPGSGASTVRRTVRCRTGSAGSFNLAARRASPTKKCGKYRTAERVKTVSAASRASKSWSGLALIRGRPSRMQWAARDGPSLRKVLRLEASTPLFTSLWPLARWPTHGPEHRLNVPIYVHCRPDHLIVP